MAISLGMDKLADRFSTISIGNVTAAHAWIDTPRGLAAALDDMRTASILAFDCEGVDLSRHGELTLLQLANRDGTVWLVDVTALGDRAFTVSATNHPGTTLKSILESRSTMKVGFDLRQDSDALFHQFEVYLRATYDLQLAEVLVRRASGFRVRFVFGFGKAIDEYIGGSVGPNVTALKRSSIALFDADPTVWARRPLPSTLVQYAANDVRFLLRLYDKLSARLPARAKDRVLAGSVERIRECERYPTPPNNCSRANVPIY